MPVSVVVLQRRVLALLALALLSAATPTLAQQPQAELVYGLRAGDRVTISFYTAAGQELPEVAGQRTVDRNGNIFLPYVGTVAAEGLDATDLRLRLVDLFSEYYNDPVVDVVAQLRVNVTGAVTRPGNYYLDPSSTILDALAAAGGTGLEVGGFGVGGVIPSDVSKIRLVREGETEIIDLRPEEVTLRVLERRIQSGDWLFVPPLGQSRVRQEVLFWGNVVGLLASIVSLIVVLSN